MAETVKKAKAPAKPRTATTKKETTSTPKAATAKATTKKATSKAAPRVPSHEEIARLAEQYWAERGHSDGHAEQDWLRAEQELLQKAS